MPDTTAPEGESVRAAEVIANLSLGRTENIVGLGGVIEDYDGY